MTNDIKEKRVYHTDLLELWLDNERACYNHKISRLNWFVDKNKQLTIDSCKKIVNGSGVIDIARQQGDRIFKKYIDWSTILESFNSEIDDIKRHRAMNQPQLIVEGRRWFQRSHGNTYHTTKVKANGDTFASPITYGYGDHYLQTAFELLQKHGYCMNMDFRQFREYLFTNDNCSYSVVDVPRKKDL